MSYDTDMPHCIASLYFHRDIPSWFKQCSVTPADFPDTKELPDSKRLDEEIFHLHKE